MPILTYAKPERVFLKGHAEYGEKWVQERIAEDPSILGLGDLVLKDKERIHPNAGRLDILCQDAESNRRYEIEIQLGKSDESHIIRTIEYWDIERKRYPQYDHVAVIVAEDITSRFLNVVGLFNGFIPIVAIQMQAFRFGDNISLVFTTVLNEMRLGLVEDDEAVADVTDRSYWEKRASKQTLAVTDSLFSIVSAFAPDLSLKYNKFYIGLARDGHPDNFVTFQPRKDWIVMELRIERSDETQASLEEAGIEVLEYGARYGKYRVRITKPDLTRSRELLLRLFVQARGDVE